MITHVVQTVYEATNTEGFGGSLHARVTKLQWGWKALAIFALLYVFFCTSVFAGTLPPPTSFPTNQCAGDRFASQNGGKDLSGGCTANDVNITGLQVVGDTTACVGGTTLPLDFAVSLNFATDDRYDVGVFLSNDGKDPKVSSTNGGAQTCSVAVLPTSSPFLNLDEGPYTASDGNTYYDTCGDGNKTIGGGTGNGVLYMTNVTVACQSVAGANGKLYVPFVVSWDNQSSDSGGSICQSNANPVPNTSSKCNSPTIVQGSVDVVVLPSISNSDGQTYVTSGSSTTYTIVITNTTGAGLDGAVFTDPQVTHFTANSVSCSAAGGASCPTSGVTVSATQGAGIALPTMPVGSSVTFTVSGTLSGTPPDTVTNTAAVTVNGRSNSAADTDIFYSGSLSISPATLSKNAAVGASVTYTYTVYNFGSNTDTVSLSATSANGWSSALSTSSLTVPGASGGTPGSATFTLTVTVPAGTTIGTADTATISAVSGNNPSHTASATAVTTAADLLTFTPDNNGSGGAGAAVYYNHTVQNNSSSSEAVLFNSVISTVAGSSCSNWTVGLYQSDKTTTLTNPLTLAGNGGSANVVVKVTIPTSAQSNDECLVTVTASAGGHTATVKDDTIVKNIILYSDPGYSNESYIYPQGNTVYAKAFGLTPGSQYYFVYTDPYNAQHYDTSTAPNVTTATGSTAYDSPAYVIPTTLAGGTPEGKWEVDIYLCTVFTGSRNNQTCDTSSTGNTLFAHTNFYVGPDHVDASYSGSNPAVNTNAVVDVSLRDINDQIPVDSSGNLVKGDPPTNTKDPLKITVSVNGSATIVSTTLTNAVISGQTVTGRLSDTTGTATVTVTDSVVETVTVSPHTYNGTLYGSPARDQSTTISYIAALDHILLQSSGNGLTCEPSPVTIEACQDAMCSALSTVPVTVTLSPSSGWSPSNSITFTGSTTVYLSSSTPQTITLGTSAVSPVPTGSSPQCSPVGCNLTFADTGFIFSSGTGATAAATIANQTAGTSSVTYYLRAVKKSDSSSACVAALNGTQQINMAYECNNPTTCYAANEMVVNGTGPTTIQRNDNGSTLVSYTPVNLTFDASGNAPFTLNYADVGQITLHAEKVVNSADLIGASNAFVVKPDHFDLSNVVCQDGIANPGATTAVGTKFCKAGEPFSVTVTAANYADNRTPSFGQESSPQTVTLSSTIPAMPTGSDNPTLRLSGSTNPAIVSTFSGGVGSANVVWDEVGVITLQPSVTGSNGYLGAGTITGATRGEDKVGRIYPDYFVLSAATDGSLANANTGGATSFTYVGQSFGYKTNPVALITAVNVAGNTTKNYTGNFDKLTTSGVTVTYPTHDNAEATTGGICNTSMTTGCLDVAPDTSANTSTLTDNGNGTPSSSTSGTLSFTISGDSYAYCRGASSPTGCPPNPSSALVAPFTANLTITVGAKDSDGVMGTYGTPGTTVPVPLNPTGNLLRYGRVAMQNANGSELIDLKVPVTAEYYNGSGFVTNTDDSDSTLINSPMLGFSDIQGSLTGNGSGGSTCVQGGSTTTSGLACSGTVSGETFASTASAGQFNLWFKAPSTMTGSFQVTAHVPAWLQYPWTGAGDVDPFAIVTFGVYQGNPRNIYIREIY